MVPKAAVVRRATRVTVLGVGKCNFASGRNAVVKRVEIVFLYFSRCFLCWKDTETKTDNNTALRNNAKLLEHDHLSR